MQFYGGTLKKLFGSIMTLSIPRDIYLIFLPQPSYNSTFQSSDMNSRIFLNLFFRLIGMVSEACLLV